MLLFGFYSLHKPAEASSPENGCLSSSLPMHINDSFKNLKFYILFPRKINPLLPELFIYYFMT